MVRVRLGRFIIIIRQSGIWVVYSGVFETKKGNWSFIIEEIIFIRYFKKKCHLHTF